MEMGLLMFPSPTGSAAMAQTAEELGFGSVVYADTQCLTPEVWSQLMLVAAATERIEIGTGVTNPVSRDPSVTASAALGLQVASGGRVVLGIGRGDSSMAKIGRRPASPADFDLYLQRLRAYLDGQEVEREGSPSRIEWLDDCEVPRVPIEVAATGPKVIDIAARRADQICFAVGADTERLGEAIAHARRSAEATDRDPDTLRFGAFVNCVIHADRQVAREAIRGGLSVFAHFSGFKGMDIESLPEGVRKAARDLRTGYDMANHAVATGDHAQALDADFIHRFGIAGPVDEAITRFEGIRDTGIDFVRVVPGSRDMPRDV
ncbi:MAG: LLM class flavin-dependent oxidoreductase, partial [Deltaproteobacteria bacterium]|nr:LLM class flavin-dependent oxidoreductase [Deltaproteobacteria bacterium]